jgi:hypothetical protein
VLDFESLTDTLEPSDRLRVVSVRPNCDQEGWQSLGRQLPAPPRACWLIRPDQHVLATGVASDKRVQLAAITDEMAE